MYITLVILVLLEILCLFSALSLSRRMGTLQIFIIINASDGYDCTIVANTHLFTHASSSLNSPSSSFISLDLCKFAEVNNVVLFICLSLNTSQLLVLVVLVVKEKSELMKK